MLNCDICGKPAIGVASSSFGAISFAMCMECVQKPAEPYMMFEYLYDDVSTDGEGLRPEVAHYYTFHNGEYISWNQYVANRAAEGRAKSKPTEIPPAEDYGSEDDVPEFFK